MTDYTKYLNQSEFHYDMEFDYFVINWTDEKSVMLYEENDGEQLLIDLDKEYGNATRQKYNMMYISKIKKHYDWSLGDVIYLNMKENCDNCFYIMRGWRENANAKRIEDKEHYTIAIDSDGFVVKRFYNNYTRKNSACIKEWAYVIRLDCVYNDYWVDIINGLTKQVV